MKIRTFFSWYFEIIFFFQIKFFQISLVPIFKKFQTQMSQHDFDHQKKKLKYFPNLCFIARVSDGKKLVFSVYLIIKVQCEHLEFRKWLVIVNKKH